MIRLYDSPQALARQAIGANALYLSGKENRSWFGEYQAETCEYAIRGNTALVPEAEKLIAELDLEIETPRRVWDRSPVGHYCVVPDVLAGLPTPMRRSAYVGDEHQPIAIYVRPNAHSGIDAATLVRRGTAILALVLALSRVRPVSLHYFFVSEGKQERDGCREDVLCARIETAPLDTATAAYVLTSAGYYRRICFGLCESLGGYIGSVVSLERCEQIAFDLMGCERARTLVIGPAHLHDPLITEPLPWIRRQIAHFIHDATEDALDA